MRILYVKTHAVQPSGLVCIRPVPRQKTVGRGGNARGGRDVKHFGDIATIVWIIIYTVGSIALEDNLSNLQFTCEPSVGTYVLTHLLKSGDKKLSNKKLIRNPGGLRYAWEVCQILAQPQATPYSQNTIFLDVPHLEPRQEALELRLPVDDARRRHYDKVRPPQPLRCGKARHPPRIAATRDKTSKT